MAQACWPAGECPLQAEIEKLFDQRPPAYVDEHFRLFHNFKAALNRGEIRAAEPDPGTPSGWRVNGWVKKGILLGFRMGQVVDMSVHAVYLGTGITCMPPMYINTGAWVDDGTMVDSHALVGSCAQLGKNCHISAASQIGGVLEPVGALPVIIEDEVLVGGNCGVYEGTVVKRRAVLGTGTILNRSTPVYDLVRHTVHKATGDEPLIIPEEAVVVAGSRAITSGPGKDWGISVYTPVIVKYRDAKTDAKIQLEDLLR
jgi:2,3,4,5-tetrahydropyridine-2-carboxylate N-succinyltransferase